MSDALAAAGQRRLPGMSTIGSASNSELVLSPAQRALWAKRDIWVDRLHRKWSSNLARADCEEVIADAILNSRLLRDARRIDTGLVRQWWAYDVKSAAIRRDSRLRGTVRTNGQRRGHDASLDAPGDDGMPLGSTLASAAITDPAELVTEGLLGQSRRYRREQATAICAEAMAALKDSYRDVLRVELEGGGQPQRVLCQQLGLTEKAYCARLKVAKEQFAKRVRSQMPSSTCGEVRALLGRPLGAQAARVEAHLEDCYPCRAWQLFHRRQAAAALLPFPAVRGWETLSTRGQGLLNRFAPHADHALPHAETAVTAGGTVAGTVLLTGAGAKIASAVCVSAISCAIALSGQTPEPTARHEPPRPPVAAKRTSGLPATPSAAAPIAAASPPAKRAASAAQTKPTASRAPERAARNPASAPAAIRRASPPPVASPPTTWVSQTEFVPEAAPAHPVATASPGAAPSAPRHTTAAPAEGEFATDGFP